MSPCDFHVCCSLTFELRLFGFIGKFSDICSASKSLCRMLSVSLININHRVCCWIALAPIRLFPQLACCCCPPVRKHVALTKSRPTTFLINEMFVCMRVFPWVSSTLLMDDNTYMSDRACCLSSGSEAVSKFAASSRSCLRTPGAVQSSEH